jgi:hypothetical protein
MVLPSTGGGLASTLCFILRQVCHTIGDSGFCGSSHPPDWLFLVSSFPPVKAGRRVPRKQRHELVWQSFLGLPPSHFHCSFSCSEGRPKPSDAPSLEVAPTTSGWSLASYASLLAALVLGGSFRSSCLFQFQALGGMFELSAGFIPSQAFGRRCLWSLLPVRPCLGWCPGNTRSDQVRRRFGRRRLPG